MTPGITASQMPPWPKERLGLSPHADAVVVSIKAEGQPVKKAEDKNLNVYRPHHIHHPLPPPDQVKPLEPAKGFYLPDTPDARKADMRGYQCYKRNLESIQKREREMCTADASCGCIFSDGDDKDSNDVQVGTECYCQVDDAY